MKIQTLPIYADTPLVKYSRAYKRILTAGMVISALLVLMATPAAAGTLTSASWTPSSTTASGSAQYNYGFTTASTSNLTKVTASVPAGTDATGSRYLQMRATANGNYATTPDTAANSITGDIDIRVKVAFTDWSSTGIYQAMLDKWTGGDRGYYFYMAPGGFPAMLTSPDGSSYIDNWATVTTGFANGTANWLRTTVDVNNGAGGNTVTFYTSSDGSSWTQLGSPVVNSGTTSIYNSTQPVAVGAGWVGTADLFDGKFYYGDVRNGIGGTIVNKFDPADASPTQAAAGSWASTSPQGETWTVNRSGSIWPADIATDLTVSSRTGVPAGGTANLRYMDGTVSYNFSSTSVTASTPCTINLSGLINTATVGTYTSLIQTWNANSPPVMVDSATTASVTIGSIEASLSLQATIDPALTFTVAGRSSVCNGQSSTNFQTGSTATVVSVGHLSSATVGGAAQDLSVVTNAANGFTVYLSTSGTTPNAFRDAAGHTVADVSGTYASPGSTPVAGTSGFGYTTSDTSTTFTSNKWAKLTNSNDSVMIASAGTLTKSACVGYEAAIASTVPAGSYSATVIYTAVPSF